MTHDMESYVRDLVYLLREAFEEANERSREEGMGDGLQAGRALAYTEVLSLMQCQADAFLIPRQLLGLDGFDPVSDFARASRKDD
jgi:hypothetical protein